MHSRIDRLVWVTGSTDGRWWRVDPPTGGQAQEQSGVHLGFSTGWFWEHKAGNRGVSRSASTYSPTEFILYISSTCEPTAAMWSPNSDSGPVTDRWVRNWMTQGWPQRWALSSSHPTPWWVPHYSSWHSIRSCPRHSQCFISWLSWKDHVLWPQNHKVRIQQQNSH